MAHTYHAFCQTVFLVSFLISLAYCEGINFTISRNPAEDELAMRCSLNETSSDITFVDSISITDHSGSVVASITAHTPARKGDNIIGVVVSGQLQQSGQERGFLYFLNLFFHPIAIF